MDPLDFTADNEADVLEGFQGEIVEGLNASGALWPNPRLLAASCDDCGEDSPVWIRAEVS
jgi:hypothetical protein